MHLGFLQTHRIDIIANFVFKLYICSFFLYMYLQEMMLVNMQLDFIGYNRIT